MVLENGGEAQELLRRQRLGFGLDLSNPKDSNEESPELQSYSITHRSGEDLRFPRVYCPRLLRVGGSGRWYLSSA